MKTCSACKQAKELSEFSLKTQRGKPGLQTYCKICSRERKRAWYQANKATERPRLEAAKRATSQKRNDWLCRYLTAHPCVDCGQTNIVVLEFDHIKGPKLGTVTYMLRSTSMKRVKEEISKCQVVCANCHRIRTVARCGGWRASFEV